MRATKHKGGGVFSKWKLVVYERDIDALYHLIFYGNPRAFALVRMPRHGGGVCTEKHNQSEQTVKGDLDDVVMTLT